MAHLSSTTFVNIERAARRSSRRLAGSTLPATVGIDVSIGERGALLGVMAGADVDGAAYEIDNLDPETIRGAILDALDIATQGPRTWRRL